MYICGRIRLNVGYHCLIRCVKLVLFASCFDTAMGQVCETRFVCILLRLKWVILLDVLFLIRLRIYSSRTDLHVVSWYEFSIWYLLVQFITATLLPCVTDVPPDADTTSELLCAQWHFPLELCMIMVTGPKRVLVVKLIC